MTPSEAHIGAAAARLAHMSRFPTFPGGTYAFCSERLDDGTWMPADHPLVQLAALVIELPDSLKHEPFPVAEAHCRVIIEDALVAALR